MLPRVSPPVFHHRVTRSEQGGVVLRADINVVRLLHIHGHRVTFGDGQIVQMKPVSGTVIRQIQTAIVAKHDSICVQGIDPHRMRVQMKNAGVMWKKMNYRSANLGERLAAVPRHKRALPDAV